MNILAQLNADISSVVADIQQSLVQIHNGHRGIGAGTIWHSHGLILTNAHVVESRHGQHHLNVQVPDGRVLPARLLETDRIHDLAALMVEVDDLPTIALGDSHALRPGNIVFAVGYPWGIGHAATKGIVIGQQGPPDFRLASDDWIAVDLHMRPGYSGGPLVNSAGELVGINTMISGPNVGYAIPVHFAKRFLKEALGTAVA